MANEKSVKISKSLKILRPGSSFRYFFILMPASLFLYISMFLYEEQLVRQLVRQCSITEACLGPSQTSMMELLAKIVNS